MSELKPIRVSMLGGCALCFGENTIDGKTVRSKRIWTLLEYLIIYRFRCVSQEELIDVLYHEDEGGAPQGKLKALVHRARELLGRLGYGEGRSLLLKCSGGYRWNPAVHLETDTERFEGLASEASIGNKSEEQKLKLWFEALELYKGDFLPEATGELWAMSITTYYRFRYMNVVREILTVLTKKAQYDEVISVAVKALAIDPYDEGLYYNLILALANTDRIQEARAQYESMAQRFNRELGVAPSKELRLMYAKLSDKARRTQKALNDVCEELLEIDAKGSERYFEYEFFKEIFKLERSYAFKEGRKLHICLVNVAGENGEALTAKSLDTAMRRLRACIEACIDADDMFSRYSVSQFVVLLTQNDQIKNKNKMERITRRFRHENPRSPAKLSLSFSAVESTFCPAVKKVTLV